MKKEKCIKVNISVPPSLWKKLQKYCAKECRSASSKIQEFILKWKKNK
jgi:hypothetical protein